MNILITLCGRGGSKGIPGKNIRLLNGKPLIAYSIEHAKQFVKHHPADIALSTDSEEIKSIAAQYGLVTDYKRPAELANDVAGKVDAIHHLVEHEQEKRNVQYECVLDLDISAPMRTVDDLLNGHKNFLENPNAYNLFSVSKAAKNPYFNMVEEKESGYYGLVKQGDERFMSRQTAPAVYELNASFYFYRQSFFTANLHSALTEKSLIYIIPHTCFDLDHTVDFDFLEYLVKENKLDFQL
jgi:CMP-N,N'-diacetyllegionaminic acid synthase